jgi:catechol 2,3-dioxygenase-like lactoylglutathione lyase family enzyme
MPVSHIEHFLVAADDIDATRDWYARVLGMRSGPHPDFGFPVHWMYAGEADVVHIGPSARAAGARQKEYLGRTSQDTGAGTGALDHIAFRATGLREMMEHLRREGVPFSQRRANGQALFQLFFYDPNGIKIELNYAAEEAVGIPLAT